MRHHYYSESLIDRLEFSLGVSDVKLPRSAKFDNFLTHHLSPLRDPADGASQGKDDSEHVTGDFEGLEHYTRIVIDVGVKFALLEIIVVECRFLQRHGEIEKLFILDLELIQYLVTHFLHLFGSWIEVLVDSVSETHNTESTILIFGFSDIFRHSVFRFNLVKHLKACLVGTTVSRTPKGSNTGLDTGERVCKGGTRYSYS